MERHRRQQIISNPADNISKRFNENLWQGQKQIVEAIFKHDRVCVKSCHGPGKTFTAGRIILSFLDAYWPSKIITTAPTSNQVKNLLWAEVNTAFLKANPAYDAVGWRCLDVKVDCKRPDHFALGFSTDEPVNFQGFHSPHILVIVDEAAGVAKDIFDNIDSLLTSEGSKILLIGNPEEAHGNFYDAFKDPSFTKFTISAFDTPNFTAFGISRDDIINGTWADKVTGPLPCPYLITPAWVADKLKWGVDSPMWKNKVDAEFSSVAVGGLIALNHIEAAQNRQTLYASEGCRGQFGLDVARFGDDRTVVQYRKGPVVFEPKIFTKMSIPEVADWAEGYIKQTDPGARIVVDAVGLGAGVADLLRERGYAVYDYTGSAKVDESVEDRDDYFNERSYFYWTLRSRFEDGDISGFIDEETKEELASIDYKYQSGKIRIAKKETIKKKLGRSPDLADALMLAFADTAKKSPNVGGIGE